MEITIKLDDGDIKIDKNILVTHSEYIDKLVASKTSDEIVIRDVGIYLFKYIITVLETSKLEVVKDDMIHKLIQIAKYCKLPDKLFNENIIRTVPSRIKLNCDDLNSNVDKYCIYVQKNERCHKIAYTKDRLIKVQQFIESTYDNPIKSYITLKDLKDYYGEWYMPEILDGGEILKLWAKGTYYVGKITCISNTEARVNYYDGDVRVYNYIDMNIRGYQSIYSENAYIKITPIFKN